MIGLIFYNPSWQQYFKPIYWVLIDYIFGFSDMHSEDVRRRLLSGMIKSWLLTMYIPIIYLFVHTLDIYLFTFVLIRNLSMITYQTIGFLICPEPLIFEELVRTLFCSHATQMWCRIFYTLFYLYLWWNLTRAKNCYYDNNVILNDRPDAFFVCILTINIHCRITKNVCFLSLQVRCWVHILCTHLWYK